MQFFMDHFGFTSDIVVVAFFYGCLGILVGIFLGSIIGSFVDLFSSYPLRKRVKFLEECILNNKSYERNDPNGRTN